MCVCDLHTAYYLLDARAVRHYKRGDGKMCVCALYTTYYLSDARAVRHYKRRGGKMCVCDLYTPYYLSDARAVRPYRRGVLVEVGGILKGDGHLEPAKRVG